MCFLKRRRFAWIQVLIKRPFIYLGVQGVLSRISGLHEFTWHPFVETPCQITCFFLPQIPILPRKQLALAQDYGTRLRQQIWSFI